MDGTAFLFGAVLAAPVQHQVVVDHPVPRLQLHGPALGNRTGGAPLPCRWEDSISLLSRRWLPGTT